MPPALQAAIADAESLTGQQIHHHMVCMPKSVKEYHGQNLFIHCFRQAAISLDSGIQQGSLSGSEPMFSGCLLVPDWPTAWFNPCLKDMQLLKQYPAKSVAPFPTKLLYCPSLSQLRIRSLFSDDAGRLTMSFKGQITHVPARICADTQASHSFISKEFVQRAGLHMTPWIPLLLWPTIPLRRLWEDVQLSLALGLSLIVLTVMLSQCLLNMNSS
jgi:hypothetical protein